MTDATPPPAPDAPHTPRAYRKRPPETWAEIRVAYEHRTPAPVLAERHDVSVWAIRKRASNEGWTHRETARRTLELDLPKLGGDRRPPEVAAAKAAADAAKAAALAEARAQAAAAQAEVDAEEADPLEAARTLLRRAAASAVAGRHAQAGAGVKLAEGLARAAAVLGLGGEAGDGWDDDEDAPRLSPEALEALRDDVERRYARFDRPAPGEEGGVAPRAEAAGAPVPPPPSRPDASDEALATPTSPPGPTALPVPWPPSPPSRGISRPSRSLSVPPWPAWAGPPDAWPRSGWGA